MSFDVGDRVESVATITEEMISDFARVSGDYNPVHMDEEYAKKTRFGRRIAHGMISGALISRTLAMNLEGGGIYLSQSLKFLVPIYIGDVVRVQLYVRSLRKEKGIAIIETTVINQKNEVCVKGEATIMRQAGIL